MSESIFLALSLVIWVVLISLGIMKALKQPMIIWYILAGTAISLFFPFLLHGNANFESFGNIGMSFLLFMVGMELNPTIIKELGKSSIISAIIQVFLCSVLGWGAAMAVGFDPMTSAYIGIWFSFSSTIVVLKLLADKDELETTSGRLSVGLLVMQDIIVMLLMLGLATFNTMDWGNISITIARLVIKIIVLWWGIFLASKYIIPKITEKIAESQEYLFLFAIGRCFILGSIFHLMWFGIEVGTLLAGISLASSSYRFEIISRVKSLRDFFIVMFFVLLGSHIEFGHIGAYLPQILILSAVVLIGKPLITAAILGKLGHTKKNSILTGASLGQISEFSFILLGMGISSWVIKDPNVLGIITTIGLITIAWSSYGIIYGEKLFNLLRPFINHFPGTNSVNPKDQNRPSYDIAICGYGRFGSNLHSYIVDHKKGSVVVIDENPKVIKHLENRDIPCMYWDLGNIEFIEEINVESTKMLISTIKNYDENMLLLKTMKNNNKNLILVFVSNHLEEALKLYEQGADYVILPHYIWVDHASLMLDEYGFDMEKFLSNKKTQIRQLKSKQKESFIDELTK